MEAPPDPSCSRKEGRAQDKTRGKSKASFIDALESRMATLETFMSVAQNTVDGLEVIVDGLKGEYVEFTIAMKAFIQDQANTF